MSSKSQDKGEPSEVTEPSNKNIRADETVPEQVLPVRDSRHYYEDGNVVFLIEKVLFKVHTSLISAQSEVLRSSLAVFKDGNGVQHEGTTDERQMTVRGVGADEFRNFLNMIYLPRSDGFYTMLETPQGLKHAFRFYLNVARVSQLFCMADSELWAVNRLKSFWIASGKTIVDLVVKTRQANKEFYFIPEALRFAGLTRDLSLRHDLRNLLQCYYTMPTPFPTPVALSKFRMLRKRQADPSMTGFWFLILLNYGYKEWHSGPFTRQDRVALFTAQVYLSIIPESLGNRAIAVAVRTGSAEKPPVIS
ncbi:The BTB (BR-C, ttk and bab)/POZ (Pox virus and Zinc finger) domain [Ceratobasidium sp. AG-Ba]|nr:The BTB (BR-C, ttk and bab)/POZ (Pox virus and Zinc finger) domain [Ceratobasidium sp. AG-Ba]